jgi:hypothetical protein
VPSELVAAFIASILTFGFGWILAERERREDRALRSIEDEKRTIERLQDAAGLLADAAGMAAILHPFLKEQDLQKRADIFSEAWFQDWQTSRRMLEALAMRVSDPALKEQALIVRNLAMRRSVFEMSVEDRKKNPPSWQEVDPELEKLNELAGDAYRSLYALEAKVEKRRSGKRLC